MARLTLINDVYHLFSDQSLLGILPNAKPTEKSERQCSDILRYLATVEQYDIFLYSTAEIFVSLSHSIRTTCLKTLNKVFKSSYCDERSFGVMTGATLDLSSDVFRNERICCEKGESVRQCKERIMGYLSSFLATNKDIVCLSHPHVCQIMANFLLNRAITTHSAFWHKKGSVLTVDYYFSSRGIAYNFRDAFNCIENKIYTADLI